MSNAAAASGTTKTGAPAKHAKDAKRKWENDLLVNLGRYPKLEYQRLWYRQESISQTQNATK